MPAAVVALEVVADRCVLRSSSRRSVDDVAANLATAFAFLPSATTSFWPACRRWHSAASLGWRRSAAERRQKRLGAPRSGVLVAELLADALLGRSRWRAACTSMHAPRNAVDEQHDVRSGSRPLPATRPEKLRRHVEGVRPPVWPNRRRRNGHSRLQALDGLRQRRAELEQVRHPPRWCAGGRRSVRPAASVTAVWTFASENG